MITFNSWNIRLVLYSCHVYVVNTMNPDFVIPAILHRVSDHENSDFFRYIFEILFSQFQTDDKSSIYSISKKTLLFLCLWPSYGYSHVSIIINMAKRRVNVHILIVLVFVICGKQLCEKFLLVNTLFWYIQTRISEHILKSTGKIVVGILIN